ncbi:MAG: ATPase, partial [Allorhizobium sp.]
RPGELDQTILSQCSTLFAMRLANDRDQEIIRSAIPNSSMSTTSFLSSIGNGEAIAFGEAITVPMRMRFARVEQRYLPKAHGVANKGDDDMPDTVDLRTVVARMRAINGPDITNFKQSFERNDAGNPEDYPEAGNPQASARAGETDLDRWASDVNSAHERLPSSREVTRREPYHPDMLPRTQADTPARPAAFDRPPTGAPELPQAAYPASYRSPVGEPGVRPSFPLRREGSLRDSLLKRPLSSLYDKD